MTLTKLGKKIVPTFIGPNFKMLECFDNPSNNQFTVKFDSEEHTSLCPVTGQPDFGKITIEYDPDELCIESKSLKLYLGAYRMYKGFMEAMTNKILDDLFKACNPHWMKVTGVWNARGGIVTTVHGTRYKTTEIE